MGIRVLKNWGQRKLLRLSNSIKIDVSFYFYNKKTRYFRLWTLLKIIRSKCGVQFSWFSAKALSWDNYKSGKLITRVYPLILRKLYYPLVKIYIPKLCIHTQPRVMMIKDRIQFDEILNIEEQRLLILLLSHDNEVNKRSQSFMCVYVFQIILPKKLHINVIINMKSYLLSNCQLLFMSNFYNIIIYNKFL